MAREYSLPRTLRNVVVQRMEELVLDPLDFDWGKFKEATHAGERIIHRPTDAHFEYYRTASQSIWCSWDPATAPNSQRGTEAKTDGAIVAAITKWLYVVKEEHEAPDLWNQLRAEASFVTQSGEGHDRPFTAKELEVLTERLDVFEERLLAIAEVSPSESAEIHVVIQESKEVASKLSKKEWKTFFLGALSNIFVRLALEPEKVRKIIHVAGTHIGPLVAIVHGWLSG
jgi:hypothetical protein